MHIVDDGRPTCEIINTKICYIPIVRSQTQDKINEQKRHLKMLVESIKTEQL